VGDIDQSVTQEILKENFEKYGEINRIDFDNQTAYLEFNSKSAVEKIISELRNTTTINDKQVSLYMQDQLPSTASTTSTTTTAQEGSKSDVEHPKPSEEEESTGATDENPKKKLKRE